MAPARANTPAKATGVTLSMMAEAAIARGYKFLAITDYPAITEALADEVFAAGGGVRLGRWRRKPEWLTDEQ